LIESAQIKELSTMTMRDDEEPPLHDDDDSLLLEVVEEQGGELEKILLDATDHHPVPSRASVFGLGEVYDTAFSAWRSQFTVYGLATMAAICVAVDTSMIVSAAFTGVGLTDTLGGCTIDLVFLGGPLAMVAYFQRQGSLLLHRRQYVWWTSQAWVVVYYIFFAWELPNSLGSQGYHNELEARASCLGYGVYFFMISVMSMPLLSTPLWLSTVGAAVVWILTIGSSMESGAPGLVSTRDDFAFSHTGCYACYSPRVLPR